MKNRLFIACAGSGKTTQLVNKALLFKERVLITTFTQENKNEIIKKVLYLNNGIIPHNITVSTWFSFLIEHGAKPYQGKLTEGRIKGLELVNKKSGVKYITTKGVPVPYKENDVENHYFNKRHEIYSDKLSKFVIKCNEANSGKVIERISKIFKHIFIDEVQDLAGYDLKIISLLLKSDSIITMVGDPRQVTYHTHFSTKYGKYKDGMIEEFIKNECSKNQCEIDLNTLVGSWRNNQIICDFANKVFPEFSPTISKQEKKVEHEGIFLVRNRDVNNYLLKFNPLQLRYRRNVTGINPNYSVMNFGEAKGITVPRVLIYPTADILLWCGDFKNTRFSFEVKCKFYVALTRAKYSVGIVCPDNFFSDLIPYFEVRSK